MNAQVRQQDMRFTNVELAGVQTALVGRGRTTEIMLEAVRLFRAGQLERPLLSSSMNGQTMFETDRSAEMRALFNAFDLVSMDGQPAVTVSRLWPQPFQERVATTDLIHDVMAAGSPLSVRHYLFGANPRVLEKAKQEIQRQHPEAIVCGSHHGYVEMADLPEVVRDIRESRTEILWVCMGVPKEQHVSLVLKDQLATDIAVLKTGGGVLDFLSGEKPRAPMILQKIGLEWVFRLGLEPRRLFERYWRSNPKALQILLQTKPKYQAGTSPLGLNDNEDAPESATGK